MESIRMSGVPGATSAVVSSGQTAARCAARPARPRHPDALEYADAGDLKALLMVERKTMSNGKLEITRGKERRRRQVARVGLPRDYL